MVNSVITLLALALLSGCAASRPVHPATPPAAGPGMAAATALPGPAVTQPPAATATVPIPPTPTPLPTDAPPPAPTNTATAPPTATMTPIAACKERHPADADLLALVSHEYGLSPDYKPGDLVPLGDTFPSAVTRGYPTQVRAVIIPQLQEMIAAMHAAELRPFIVSGFRGYYDQAAARQKWTEQFPEWAHNVSARPGHSEHQLGTTLDFSTPDLPAMVGETFIEFHPAFAASSEGKWLAENGHEYGFTMSYPDDRYEATGFNYEPWHFRYVGVELSTLLHENSVTISEYLLAQYGPPCRP
ncbi:MAG: M15 family metallopeptidase [Anaerolineae bacterium]|nr:M15 family metallopeptidase [Anaerolineae bacterium]